jgi:hypothetical protein
MKKTLIALALTMSFIANAEAQFFYAQGGLNLSNISNAGDGSTEDNGILASFNAGLMARFGLSKVVDLESGILFTGKGAKAETYFNGGNDYVKSRFNPLYIEVPLNLVINIPFGGENNSGFFVYGGPYVAVGVGGKSKLDTKLGTLTTSAERNIKFNNDDPFTSIQEDAAYDKLKRFDAGLNVGLGIDFTSVIIKANYGLGLTKIGSTQENNNSDDKNKYRVFSLSIGIPFGR